MKSLGAVPHWDFETDILICGFGAAGSSAAIEARDLAPDADILIIEKATEARSGGNARVSGQSLLISKNAEALARYQRTMSVANPIPEDMLLEWAERMTKLEPWIKARAAEAGQEFLRGTGFTEREAVLEFPDLGAAEAVAYTATILPIPSGVWKALKANVDKRDVRVMYETRAMRLVQNVETLEVLGMIIETPQGRQAIKARKGVIMAVGGFENDLQMQRDYYGLSDAFPLGSPTNTGDGLRILQRAGAQMWHLRNQGQSGGVWPGLKIPAYETVYLRNFLLPAFSWIDVDIDGKRFYPETNELQLTHYKEKRHGRYLDTPLPYAGPVHMIFDETTRAAGKLVMEVMTWNAVVEDYEWSEENVAEVEAGWIVKADTIAELAAKIGKSPDQLIATVAAWNQSCAEGEDKAFSRRPDTLSPITTGPFYAVDIKPAIVCTGGGAKRTIDGHVLGHDDRPIPRLFEAGELGSMFSDLYQNGSYLTEAMISGRAAAASALALSPWDADGGEA
ncbi:MAG: FAD-dependent oxidoreductase [Pseudomonadota bacterium]|uniref:FAD-dependent oxidoreductase n=1 Tax=Phenylobacterium sp. TaxID=1871053 RepID=UPI0025D4DEF6|nr:FAD-dependent oxidoreductase [Phenylobacterium sp.]MBT9469848.1 FAD-dependent oxidoreductase [Phenylobacterium sp.]